VREEESRACEEARHVRSSTIATQRRVEANRPRLSAAELLVSLRISATGLLSPSGVLLLLALPFLSRLIQGVTALDEEASLLQGKCP
jgi:hypothetical protein